MNRAAVVVDVSELRPRKPTKAFHAYGIGLYRASVCTSLSVTAAERRLNREYPTGILRDWKLANENFRGGKANPGVCEHRPVTHNHYLFSC